MVWVSGGLRCGTESSRTRGRPTQTNVYLQQRVGHGGVDQVHIPREAVHDSPEGGHVEVEIHRRAEHPAEEALVEVAAAADGRPEDEVGAEDGEPDGEHRKGPVDAQPPRGRVRGLGAARRRVLVAQRLGHLGQPEVEHDAAALREPEDEDDEGPQQRAAPAGLGGPREVVNVDGGRDAARLAILYLWWLWCGCVSYGNWWTRTQAEQKV